MFLAILRWLSWFYSFIDHFANWIDIDKRNFQSKLCRPERGDIGRCVNVYGVLR